MRDGRRIDSSNSDAVILRYNNITISNVRMEDGAQEIHKKMKAFS